jgi:hypothetical protein
MKSELDARIWAVVTAAEVICMSKTYEQCIMIMENLGNQDYLAITTNNAAAEMQQNKINYAKL